jgi:hypothetical protein
MGVVTGRFAQHHPVSRWAGPRRPVVGRRLRLWLLAMVAVPWAMMLVMGGLWLLIVAPNLWPLATPAAVVGGLTAIAAGHLVFAVCLADRLFPRAGRLLGAGVELASACAVFLGCAFLLAWTVWSWAGGG